MLIKYPDTTTTILKSLSDLCTASVPLTLTTIRGIMVRQLQHLVPQIFLEPSKDSTLFQCSEDFVQKFLKCSLGWSLQHSTCAGGKIPENSLEILKKAFLRMAYTINDKEIPSALIVNSDQTQVTLAQGCHMTYTPIGSKQVVTAGSEEKRVITVMVSLSNNGTLLPFQVIFKGSTQTSLPSKKAKSFKEATEVGFLFESSMTQTYWSTQDTMHSFVNWILVPYYDKIKKELGLPPQQRSMWQINCWSVHRSKEFMTWMGKSRENIVVNFVPARMTGLFQLADVSIQRILKQSM